MYAAAIGAQFGLDFAASAVRNRIGLGVPMRAHAREMPPIWLVDLLLSPIGLAGALLASATGEFAWLLLAPLAVLLRAFAQERNARLDQALELSGTYRRIVLLLGDVVREDERVTGSHSQEVVSLAVTVADELRLGEDERQLVEFAALLHDVGKIALQQRVVTKEGPLDPGEWEAMRRHTIEGQRLLDRVGGSLRDVGAIVRSSHERWDGHGYPDGLAGEQIPIAARIVACADAFTAMVTERSYRPALSREEALAELAAGAGTQFDPTIAAATISVVERFNLPRRSAAARTETRAIALSRS